MNHLSSFLHEFGFILCFYQEKAVEIDHDYFRRLNRKQDVRLTLGYFPLSKLWMKS